MFKLQLVGPISGVLDHDERFAKAELELLCVGYAVCNPCKNFCGRKDLPYEIYMGETMKQIEQCDGIALLPGWQRSPGSMRELDKAILTGKEWLTVDEWKGQGMMRNASVLREAEGIIHGQRNSDYGTPERNLGQTAMLWSALLNHPITAQQVALCMVALKLSRETHAHRRDNLVDGCGYLALIEVMVRSASVESTHTAKGFAVHAISGNGDSATEAIK